MRWSGKNACSYETLTNIPFEYKDTLKLVDESLINVRQNYWNLIKSDLHLSKAIPNINHYNWISLNNRAYDVLLARFRNGCADLNEFLYKIKKRDNPYCNNCIGVSESIEHFVLHCKTYENARLDLYNKLTCLKIKSNEVNLQILLTGGQFADKKRTKILKIFVDFVKQSKRFDCWIFSLSFVFCC